MCPLHKKVVYHLKVIIDNMLQETRFSMVVTTKENGALVINNNGKERQRDDLVKNQAW